MRNGKENIVTNDRTSKVNQTSDCQDMTNKYNFKAPALKKIHFLRNVITNGINNKKFAH